MTILLAQLIYVDVVKAKCRPGLMMCDRTRRKGKREGKVRSQQHVLLEAGSFLRCTQSDLLLSFRRVLKLRTAFENYL